MTSTAMPSSWMQLALAAAEQNRHITTPNPCVGACLVSPLDALITTGATQAAGSAHAEIVAMRQATSAGHDLRGASLYVTLEPCAHHGRTGPCADAIILAGIGRVFAAMTDPNPLVAGQGFRRLLAAGIAVTVGDGAHQAREQMLGFLSRMTRQRPWLRLKAAASLDGFTALPSGQSQWITGEQARADGHAWRARACAVLTGIGTVKSDDPQLNVRGTDTPRQPTRVVIDSALETPPQAKLLRSDLAGGKVWIYCTEHAPAARQQALQLAGAEVISLPATSETATKLDLLAVMRDLASRGINEVHVEAGFKLNGSLLSAGLVDEVLLYTAPKLLGAGLGLARVKAIDALADALPMQLISAQAVGADLRSIWRITDPQSFAPI